MDCKDIEDQPTLSALEAFATHGGLSRPLLPEESARLANLERLRLFLATAPSAWSSPSPPALAHPALNRFLLPNGEHVTCVLWGGLYHITGTDIVRALVFRFEAFGRPVRNMKKFEEGVFSDLRNLKPGQDACLEEPKSAFLDLLFKYQCIRTQKKQKVFYWFSVPHDRLFLDALERDLKREKMGLEPTTALAAEPALSFTYDPKRSLFDQFANKSASSASGDDTASSASPMSSSSAELPLTAASAAPSPSCSSAPPRPHPAFLCMFSLFEGSPSYKTRRRRQPKARRSDSQSHYDDGYVHPQQPRYLDDSQIRPSVAHALGLGLSASDAFLAQANPPSLAPSGPHYLPALDPRSHPGPGRAHTFPVYAAQPQQPQSAAAAYAQTPVQTTKAYQCPLFSCARLFKRMEHLKRHVRTHTLERPYPCDRCTKRFARADNLRQHTRVHQRADATGTVPDDDDAELVEMGGVRSVELATELDIGEGGATPPPHATASGMPAAEGASEYLLPPASWSAPTSTSPAPYNQASPTAVHQASPAAYSAPLYPVSALPATHAGENLFAFEPASGPVRRHRSATPTRPATSFHPYAHAYRATDGGASPMFVPNGLSSSRSSPAGYTVSLDSAPFAYAPVVSNAYDAQAQAQAQPEYVAYRPQQPQQYFEHHAAGADGYYGQAGVVM